MLKNTLLDFLKDGKSTRQIAKETNKGATTVRYWLRKYGLKTEYRKQYMCRCGETDPKKFYGNKKRICGKCHNEWVHNAGREKRKKAIQYLGGECKKCGYDKYYGSIDLHHINAKVKDSKFKQLRGWSWERIKKEIENCIPLCKNCHYELHAGVTKV